MCDPAGIGLAIAVGAATGAVGSAVTGGDPLQGALMGAVMGGVTAGMGGLAGHGGMLSGVGEAMNLSTAGVLGTNVSFATLGGYAATSLAGSIGMGMLSPQQQNYNLANTGMPYTPQPYNTQHMTVTGSGGRQAAAVLAEEMKKAKSLRQRQAGVADYGLGMDVTGTGLQIA